MSTQRKVGLDYLRIFATIQVILFHNYHFNGYGYPSTNFFLRSFQFYLKLIIFISC